LVSQTWDGIQDTPGSPIGWVHYVFRDSVGDTEIRTRGLGHIQIQNNRINHSEIPPYDNILDLDRWNCRSMSYQIENHKLSLASMFSLKLKVEICSFRASRCGFYSVSDFRYQTLVWVLSVFAEIFLKRSGLLLSIVENDRRRHISLWSIFEQNIPYRDDTEKYKRATENHTLILPRAHDRSQVFICQTFVSITISDCYDHHF
jgi:hypothetical protein